MRQLSIIACLIFITSCSNNTSKEVKNDNEVTIALADGVTLYGDLFTTGKSAPIIFLFHQGGSNSRAEYTPIIPRLTEKGYNVLAIDQRVGGQIYGSYNRTIANQKLDDYSYCDVLPDLKGAITYIEDLGFTGPKIIWGSSYSAALVIKFLATEKPNIQSALAFSPSTGNAVADCHPNDYLDDIEIPLLILRPSGEMERPSSVEQFNLADSLNIATYIAENGTHASSMLVQERVEGSVAENWEQVMDFIQVSIKND